MTRILLIKDLVNQRNRKLRELEFYGQRKAELETKVGILQAEIRLTDQILALIKKEELLEIK